MDAIKCFLCMPEGAYTIGKSINTLHDRAYELNCLYRNRVDAIKYFLCMSRWCLYYWQNDRYGGVACLSVLCIEAAWTRSNTFCACLEGAYTIDKTIDSAPQAKNSIFFLPK